MTNEHPEPEPGELAQPIEDGRLSMTAKFARVVATALPIAKDKRAKIDTKGGGKGYEYNYTDINAVLAHLRPLLDAEGLVLTQPLSAVNGWTKITTLLFDVVTGEQLTLDGPAFETPRDPQAAGSAITYWRRYALVSLFGLRTPDDDGGQASRAVTNPKQRTEAEKEIRAVMADLDKAARSEMISDFKAKFAVGLTDLPESRHGEALAWVRNWMEPDEMDIAPPEGIERPDVEVPDDAGLHPDDMATLNERA